MEDLFELVDVNSHDTTREIADKLLKEIFNNISKSDEVIAGEEYEWKDNVTKADVYELLNVRIRGKNSVSFKSVSNGYYSNKRFERPKNKEQVSVETINEYESRGIYDVTCPTCFGSGVVSKMHGRNRYYECTQCETGIKL